MNVCLAPIEGFVSETASRAHVACWSDSQTETAQCHVGEHRRISAFPETGVIGLHFPQIVWVYLNSFFIQIFLPGSLKRIFSARVRIGYSRSSKIIDFGTNRKRDFY